jgi:hypothetical protein
MDFQRPSRIKPSRLIGRRFYVAVVLGLCVSQLACVAQVTTASSFDPVCGYIAGPHFSGDATRVQQGLAVSLTTREVRAGQPVTLRFFVCERPRNFPVERLQIEHEKFMHVIGVREDFKEFFHLHPNRIGPGVWEATHTFPQGGVYHLWTDVKYRGTTYSFAQAPLQVTGRLGPEMTKASRNSTVGNYYVDLGCAQAPVAGATNELRLVVRDSNGAPTELEKFLGVPVHLVVLSADRSVYLHGHPEVVRLADDAVRFKSTFPQAGTYKLFAQFRPKHADLPPGEALLAEFTTEVMRAQAAR